MLGGRLLTGCRNCPRHWPHNRMVKPIAPPRPFMPCGRRPAFPRACGPISSKSGVALRVSILFAQASSRTNYDQQCATDSARFRAVSASIGIEILPSMPGDSPSGRRCSRTRPGYECGTWLRTHLHGVLGALVCRVLLDFDRARNRQADELVKRDPLRRPEVFRDQQMPGFVATGRVAGELHEIRRKFRVAGPLALVRFPAVLEHETSREEIADLLSVIDRDLNDCRLP